MPNYLKITFEKPFYKDIDELYFNENNDLIYCDNSHMNYIYSIKKNDIDYTFYGYFKDGFFVIIFDEYNEILNIKIESKYMFLIKLEWINKNVSLEKSLWYINNNINNYNTEACLLVDRQRLLNGPNIDFNDYLKLNNYRLLNISINNTDEIIIKNVKIMNNLKTIFKSIKTLLSDD
jgi:hypothetical protein